MGGSRRRADGRSPSYARCTTPHLHPRPRSAAHCRRCRLRRSGQLSDQRVRPEEEQHALSRRWTRVATPAIRCHLRLHRPPAIQGAPGADGAAGSAGPSGSVGRRRVQSGLQVPWARPEPRVPAGPPGPAGTFSGSFKSPNGLYSIDVLNTGLLLKGPGGSVKIDSGNVIVQGTVGAQLNAPIVSMNGGCTSAHAPARRRVNDVGSGLHLLRLSPRRRSGLR